TLALAFGGAGVDLVAVGRLRAHPEPFDGLPGQPPLDRRAVRPGWRPAGLLDGRRRLRGGQLWRSRGLDAGRPGGGLGAGDAAAVRPAPPSRRLGAGAGPGGRRGMNAWLLIALIWAGSALVMA